MIRYYPASTFLLWLIYSATSSSSTGSNGGGGVVVVQAAGAEEQVCDANGVCKSVGSSSTCSDNHEECETWYSQGECDANPKYMLVECRKSCFVCGTDDDFERAPGDGSDFGVPQTLGNAQFMATEVLAKQRLARVNRYMKYGIAEIPDDIQAKCRNWHADCINWAVGGECDGNPIWMKKECAPACLSCEFLVMEQRCPMDSDSDQMKDVWKADDLNVMFEKLTQEPYLSDYSVEILSSPSKNNGPWVIQLDNVLSPEEAAHLIELGAIEGYQRSADVGKLSVTGGHDAKISTGRTSTNAWCMGVCYHNATAQAVIHRLSDLTGVPERNSEYLQMLRYEPGQYYNSHHDYIGHHLVRQQGPRILTFYLYLNDVEAGGGTEFDKLGLEVKPKVGRAVLWPSVLNEAPSRKDDRTMHAALPVEAGIKYGANAWFHLRNFKEPYATGCI